MRTANIIYRICITKAHCIFSVSFRFSFPSSVPRFSNTLYHLESISGPIQRELIRNNISINMEKWRVPVTLVCSDSECLNTQIE